MGLIFFVGHPKKSYIGIHTTWGGLRVQKTKSLPGGSLQAQMAGTPRQCWCLANYLSRRMERYYGNNNPDRAFTAEISAAVTAPVAFTSNWKLSEVVV